MTKLSTALVLISGKGFGPFVTEGWRITGSVEVVEGGGAGPFLLCSTVDTPLSEGRTVVLTTDDRPSTMGKALLMAVAHLVGGKACEAILANFPADRGASGEKVFTDPTYMTEELRVDLAREIITQYRLGILELEQDTVIADGVLDFLGEAGFQLDVFAKKSGVRR